MRQQPSIIEYIAAYTFGLGFTVVLSGWIALRNINEKIGPFEILNKLVGEPFNEAL